MINTYTDGELVSLEDLEPGSLFVFDGCLALKTEYMTEAGAVESFIVGSGEMFWGGTSDPMAQRKIMVRKVVCSPPMQKTSQAKRPTMRNVVTHEDCRFEIVVEFDTKVEKRINGDRWNTITVIAAPDNSSYALQRLAGVLGGLTLSEYVLDGQTESRILEVKQFVTGKLKEGVSDPPAPIQNLLAMGFRPCDH